MRIFESNEEATDRHGLSSDLLKVHDAINTTLANIAVGRVSITLGWVAHAGTNNIMLKLAPKVSASYNFAASWDLVQYKHSKKVTSSC